MLITKDQMEQRLSSPDNLANQLCSRSHSMKVEHLNRGGEKVRGQEKLTYTNEERALVGAVTRLTTIKDSVRAFGVGKTSAHLWSQGRTANHYGEPIERPELKQAIEGRLGIVRDKALDKLLDTLGVLKTEKVEQCNPVQISSIAANLSTVVTKTMPSNVNISGSNVVLYAPRQRKIEDFDVRDT